MKFVAVMLLSFLTCRLAGAHLSNRALTRNDTINCLLGVGTGAGYVRLHMYRRARKYFSSRPAPICFWSEYTKPGYVSKTLQIASECNPSYYKPLLSGAVCRNIECVLNTGKNVVITPVNGDAEVIVFKDEENTYFKCLIDFTATSL